MAHLQQWLQAHRPALELLGSFSLIMLVGTLLAVPFVVIRLPANYFAVRRRKQACRSGRFFIFRIGFIIIKNLLGMVIIIAGLAMLFLPGQGILTILIGLALTNFPGKFTIERRIACRPRICRTLNWIRAKANKPPFEM